MQDLPNLFVPFWEAHGSAVPVVPLSESGCLIYFVELSSPHHRTSDSRPVVHLWLAAEVTHNV